MKIPILDNPAAERYVPVDDAAANFLAERVQASFRRFFGIRSYDSSQSGADEDTAGPRLLLFAGDIESTKLAIQGPYGGKRTITLEGYPKNFASQGQLELVYAVRHSTQVFQLSLGYVHCCLLKEDKCEDAYIDSVAFNNDPESRRGSSGCAPPGNVLSRREQELHERRRYFETRVARNLIKRQYAELEENMGAGLERDMVIGLLACAACCALDQGCAYDLRALAEQLSEDLWRELAREPRVRQAAEAARDKALHDFAKDPQCQHLPLRLALDIQTSLCVPSTKSQRVLLATARTRALQMLSSHDWATSEGTAPLVTWENLHNLGMKVHARRAFRAESDFLKRGLLSAIKTLAPAWNRGIYSWEAALKELAPKLKLAIGAMSHPFERHAPKLNAFILERAAPTSKLAVPLFVKAEVPISFFEPTFRNALTSETPGTKSASDTISRLVMLDPKATPRLVSDETSRTLIRAELLSEIRAGRAKDFSSLANLCGTEIDFNAADSRSSVKEGVITLLTTILQKKRTLGRIRGYTEELLLILAFPSVLQFVSENPAIRALAAKVASKYRRYDDFENAQRLHELFRCSWKHRAGRFADWIRVLRNRLEKVM